MAIYYFLGGDSFDNPSNWYNVTAGKRNDGVPGPNDTISGNTVVIPAAGETVANAEGTTSKPAEISGNLTITGEGSDLWLFGGKYSIGTVKGGYIVISSNTTVSAGSVNLSQPNNTGLTLANTGVLTVRGSVVANGDNIDTAGTFNVHGGVKVTKATLEIDGGATIILGALGLYAGSYLNLYGGSATVGSLNVVGSTVHVQVGPSSSGATLEVTGDATVTSGSLSVLAGCTLTVAKTLTIANQKTGNGQLIVEGSGAKLDNIGALIVGQSGAGTMLIENRGYVHASTLYDGSDSSSNRGTGTITVSDGGTNGGLGVAGSAYVGADASGSLTVQNDGAVHIGSDLYVGADGHITVSSDSEIAVGGITLLEPDGSVVIGKDGVVSLDCASGDYNANTVINGGTLTLERTGAIAGANGISFFGRGNLTLNSGVTLSNKISKFGGLDIIDLDGVTANDKSYSNGTLTLENGTVPVETLHFVGSYTTSNFRLETYTAGTEVTFDPSGGSAASIQEQIFNSALLSDSLAYHPLGALGGRGSAVAGATPDLLSVGHAPGGG
jgi:fibronectin-binding autotransporter adhesin